ncbi:hypothetical protein [Chryseobacterium indologenes]|uniref:Uncharacterized protein n=1 Tax=Chryseobacterium indologenes TaxID=253 RepID=A0A0N0ZXE0_CHRID|nr:hypothetical protein [Chryseobacterium indologenes]KPE51746.1 hypothetical protein AOB46_08860 [Chryseobacterium indologenes]
MKSLILKTIFIIALFLNIKVGSQILVNNDAYFQIYLDKEFMINDSPASYHKNSFIIINNTNKNYVINARGFMGFGDVYKNGMKITPYLFRPPSKPSDWGEKECKDNILIIPAKKSIKAVLRLSVLRGWYKIYDDADYIVDFETEHTKESPYYYGCEKYVDSLKNKGYKIYEGMLKGKVKLIPEQ